MSRPGDSPAAGGRAFAITLVFIAAFLLVHVVIVAQGVSPVRRGELVDTDSYTWALRAERLLTGAGWFDTGGISHWTRPFDVVVAGMAVPAVPFVGARRAVFLAAVVIAPLLTLLTCLATARMASDFVRTDVLPLVPIAVIGQPLVAAYSVAGRVDHHVLIVLLSLFALSAALRSVQRSAPGSDAVVAGVVTGVGLWISTEFLATLLVLVIGFGVAWLVRGQGMATAGRRFSVAFVATLAAALVIERGPHGIAVIEYDRISIAHVLLGAVVAAFWTGLEAFGDRRPDATWRIGSATTLAAGAAAILAAAVPGLLRGPFAGVDAATMDLWLRHVTELHPLIGPDSEGAGAALLYAGPILVALPWCATGLVRSRGSERFPAWAMLAAALVIFGGLAALQLRWSTYVEVLGAIGLVGVLGAGLTRLDSVRSSGLRTLSRVGLAFVLLAGFPLLGAALLGARTRTPTATAAAPVRPCSIRALADALPAGAAPRTIVALMDFGPELLYRTAHRVVATPYHRDPGIVASHRMLARPEPEARANLAAQRVDWILLCPARDASFFGGAGGTLYDRLVAGSPPDWIRPVPLQAMGAGGFLLFEVEA